MPRGSFFLRGDESGRWSSPLVHVVVVLAIVLVGASEFFEEIGILDGCGDFIVAAGPLAEVDAAAAIGAEGEVFAGGEDDVAASGATKGLDFGGCRFVRHDRVILTLSSRERRIS
jgi:hypothetical protein